MCVYIYRERERGSERERIYYIKINYMFRPLTMAIFRLMLKKLCKQLYSTYVGCIQWGGKRWGGHEISHVLCGMSGVDAWGSAVILVCYV